MNEILISQNNSVTTEKHSTEINRITVYVSQKDVPTHTEAPRSDRAQFYARLFEKLLEKYAGQDEITLYTVHGTPRKTDIEELRSCKQIYTDDHTETFWKERNYIPRSEKLFLAPSGSLFEIKMESGSRVFYLCSVPKHIRGGNRVYYDLRYRPTKTGGQIAPEKLAILVFNGLYSPNVRKLLDKKGPQIIFSDEIQVHHIYGYLHCTNPEEKEIYDAFNCNLRRIQLLTKEEHILFNSYHRNMSDEEIKKFWDKIKKVTNGKANGYNMFDRYHGLIIFDTSGEEGEEQNTQK